MRLPLHRTRVAAASQIKGVDVKFTNCEQDRTLLSRVRWRCLLLTVTLHGLSPLLAVAQSPPSLYSTAPENFTTNSHVVSTDVFTWFTSDGGQVSGPWQPLEGRGPGLVTCRFETRSSR